MRTFNWRAIAVLLLVSSSAASVWSRASLFADRPSELERYSPAHRELSFNGCKESFPRNVPLPLTMVSKEWKPYALCSANFAVLYSGLSKSPLIVIEKLNKAQLADAQGEERTDEFFADPRLPPNHRAELSDFRGSGKDRGHLAPAADQPNQAAMVQSFALSNMVMQDPQNNRKTWAGLEKSTRKFALRATGNVFVYSGPIFRGTPETIGSNRVWVPTQLFKLVYDEANTRAWAYIIDNTAEARVERPVPYAEFMKITGLQPLLGLPVTGSISDKF